MKNKQTNVGSFATAKLQAKRLRLLAIIALAFVFINCKHEPEPIHTHDSGVWITTLEPTCTEAGLKELRCTVDGAVLSTDTIAALGHDWIDNWQAIAPTCTETGGDKRTCNRVNCTETQSQNEIKALGHDYQNYTRTIDPTCTAGGEETGTCTHDTTHKNTRQIAALGHTPNIETGICTVCSFLIKNIGDTGPGGGKIFYLSAVGFTVQMADPAQNYTAHYLEAAPSTISDLNWASISMYPSVSTGTAIGTGRKNTDLILTADAAAPAALACKNLTAGGKSDWFLPSKDELNQLFVNRASVGNLNPGPSDRYYWSSSQGEAAAYAWVQTFGGGSQYTIGKIGGSSISVSAVRAF